MMAIISRILIFPIFHSEGRTKHPLRFLELRGKGLKFLIKLIKGVKTGMKTLIVSSLFLLVTMVQSQSVHKSESGTIMSVLTGADLCNNVINDPGFLYVINSPGILYSGRTICGNVVALESDANNELPLNFDMSQNYPNPFNPSTLIKYQLPNASYISLKLYDQLGREVRSLYEGNQEAGYFQITIDGTNLASGLYFCRLTSGDASSNSGKGFTKVIKMSLIK